MTGYLKHLAMALAVMVASTQIMAEEIVPKHVLLARDIVENIKPENNAHVTTNRYVDLPTDWTLFGKKDYKVNTDCIGFIESIIERSYGKMPQPATKKFKSRYSIIDYVDSVDSGYIMQKLSTFTDVKVGDLLMWKYITRREGQTTNGHIVLVNKAPRQLKRSRIKDLIQWEVEVIDNNSGPIAPKDTRYVEGTTAEQADMALEVAEGSIFKSAGTGRGRMFFFTDADGVIQAASYGFPKSSIKRQDVNWHIVMARP